MLFPTTPSLNPQTPRKDKDATPTVPTTPRQAALAERIRQRALATPSGKTTTVTLSYDAETNVTRTADLTAAQLRRRCLLARLPDAAETLLAMFVTRRVIPLREASRVIVSASRVTAGEAEDEVRMLAELCPKFLRLRVVEREEWVERGSGVVTGKVVGPLSPGGSKLPKSPGGSRALASPAKKPPPSPSAKVPATPSRTKAPATPARAAQPPVSPSRLRTPGTSTSTTPQKGKEVEVFGLKEVREVVRRELEAGVH